jgi:hypothetical protein
MGIFPELTLETLAMFDVGQNISNFNQNNNTIRMDYKMMNPPHEAGS